MIGSTIGQYKVIERLGEGGMGVVYKARDTKLDRTVAIKVLPPEFVADAGRNARFVQEAKAASALNHPNIVTVHDIVSHQAGECLVMEYIEGRPLALLIAEKGMRLAEVLRIAAQTADAIAAAHAAGIIHRDLKPANIMVTAGGLVKVLDFGLAKLVSGSGSSPGVTLTMPRTDPGTVVGTPGYMSPEQVRGQELDRRSDIFNFGLILYEMLSGARAFQGETTADVASAILKESPPDLPDTVPAALRQIVAVCLEKSPTNRFESARDIGHALRALSAGTSITGAMPKGEEAVSKSFLRRRWPLALATATSITTVLFAALYFLSRPAPLDTSSYKFTPVATDAEPEWKGAWSPDGKSIAFFKRIDGQNQLFVRDLNAIVPTQLTKGAMGAGGTPMWSPRGDKIYYLSDEKIWTVGVAGGEPQLVVPSANTAAALSPDGNALVFWDTTTRDNGRSSTVWISSPPGAPPRKYEPSPFEYSGKGSPVHLRFSPDGSKICLSEVFSRSVWLLDWPDGPKANPHRLFPGRNFMLAPAIGWLPDSRHLVVVLDGGLWEGDTRAGDLRRLTASQGSKQDDPSISPDGRRLLFSAVDMDYDIMEIPLDGSAVRPFLATAQNEFSPSWSSAGDRMAFVTNKSGKDEIMLRSPSGDWEKTIVSQTDFQDGLESEFENVALSPSGNQVAYTRQTDQNRDIVKLNWEIWISPASGGRAMPSGLPPGVSPNWSPDGTYLASVSWEGSRPEIAVIRVGSPDPPRIYRETGATSRPVWSPNGRWIAFGNGNEVILVSPDFKQSRKIPIPLNAKNNDFVMVWSQDSSTIYAATSESGRARLYAIDAGTGRARVANDLGKGIFFRARNNYGETACLSPHGKSILVTIEVCRSDLWILEGFPQPGR